MNKILIITLLVLFPISLFSEGLRDFNGDMTDGTLSCFAIDSSGNLFIGSRNGILLRTPDETKCTHVSYDILDRYVYDLEIVDEYMFALFDNNKYLFRSSDQGKTWKSLGINNLQGYFYNLQSAGSTIFFNGIDRITYSFDYGETCSEYEFDFYNEKIIDIEIIGDIVYVLTDKFHLYVSEDNFKTFELRNEVSVSMKIGGNDRVLAIGGGTINGSHIFLSYDQGRTFTDTVAFFTSAPTVAIFSDPINDDLYFVNSKLGVIKSTDDGATWQEFNTGLGDKEIDDFKYYNLHESHRFLYLKTEDGAIYRTSHKKDNWNKFATGLLSVYDIVEFDDALFIGTSKGFYRNGWKATGWYEDENDLNELFVFQLINDSDEVLYARTDDGLYYAIDGWYDWYQINQFGTYYKYEKRILNYEDNTFYGLRDWPDDHTVKYLARTTNFGITWESAFGYKDEPPHTIVFYAKNGILINQNFNDNELVVSSDNGETNQIVQFGNDNEDFKINCFSEYDGKILVGTRNAGIYSSSNFGTEWNTFDSPLDSIVALYQYNNSLFATGKKGIYVLLDDTWINVDENFKFSSFVTDIYNDGTYLYVTTSLAGIFRIDLVEISPKLVGVDEITVDKELNIYPNPAESHIRLNLNSSIPAPYSIYNTLGTKVLSGILSGDQIEISHLPGGVYFLKADNQTKSFIKN
jgi:hypothetical protein